MGEWKILLEHPVGEETDLVAEQLLEPNPAPDPPVIPSGTIEDYTFPTSPLPSRTRFVVTFLDAFKVYLTSARGTFDYTYIEAVFERDSEGAVIQESLVVLDSEEFTGGIGYRIILAPDLSDGQLVTVRLFNIQPPEGSAFVRVLYREF